MKRRHVCLAGLSATSLFLAAPIARADNSLEAQAATCISQGNVFVVVQRDSGPLQGNCATNRMTAKDALTNAGFTIMDDGAAVNSINDYPAAPSEDHQWMNWSGAFDGDKFTWKLETDFAIRAPEPGAVEGWRYVSFESDSIPTPDFTPSQNANPGPGDDSDDVDDADDNDGDDTDFPVDEGAEPTDDPAPAPTPDNGEAPSPTTTDDDDDFPEDGTGETTPTPVSSDDDWGDDNTPADPAPVSNPQEAGLPKSGW